MKKKGLIISTVVMVVVLIASLTTATYAWFQSSNVTTITGFNLKVTSSAAISIGVKTNNTYNSTPAASMFMNGNVTYTGTNAGALAGTWSGGADGFGPSLQHNIYFGTISKAVGWSVAGEEGDTDAQKLTKSTPANTKDISTNPAGLIVAANVDAKNAFTGQSLAVVNGNGATAGSEVQGDVAYLFLGVTPNGTLKAGTNKVYVIVQMGAGATTASSIGLASAIHVAYRLNSTGAWTEKDIFDSKHYGSTWGSLDNVVLNFVVDNAALTAAGITGVGDTDTSKTTIQNAVAYEITLNDLAMEAIDQLELVIYVSGTDSDCNDAAKNTSANIAILFGAQLAAAAEPTA